MHTQRGTDQRQPTAAVRADDLETWGDFARIKVQVSWPCSHTMQWVDSHMVVRTPPLFLPVSGELTVATSLKTPKQPVPIQRANPKAVDDALYTYYPNEKRPCLLFHVPNEQTTPELWLRGARLEDGVRVTLEGLALVRAPSGKKTRFYRGKKNVVAVVPVPANALAEGALFHDRRHDRAVYVFPAKRAREIFGKKLDAAVEVPGFDAWCAAWKDPALRSFTTTPTRAPARSLEEAKKEQTQHEEADCASKPPSR